MALDDTLKMLAANVVELPEEISKVVGEGFAALGNELKAVSERLAAVEEKLRAGG